jgi:glycosyltransferase involved in cell wall biosynthesis
MFYPLPANNGVKMRTWAMLRALAAEGHELTLATFADPAQPNGDSAELSAVCRHVESVPRVLHSLSSGANYWGRLKGAFSLLPYGVQQARSEEMERRIHTLLASQPFDAIFSEQADPLINLPPSLSVPVILNNHNLDHMILQRYLRFERNPAKKAYARLEGWKTRRWQQASCRRSALALACSEFDRKAIQSFAPQTPVMVAPNIVDVDSYQPKEAELPGTVLYQGGMDWYPNRDAVEFFVSAILPKIRAVVPQAKFVVGGRSPSDAFRRRFSAVPGVEFTGTVPDMRAEIAKASVCVVPLRIGSGTRLKILEAAAMAKPIVSTRVGAEGLDFVDGEEILLADEPGEFAEAVVSLLGDPARRRQVGQAADRRVRRECSSSALQGAVQRAVDCFQSKISVGTRH